MAIDSVRLLTDSAAQIWQSLRHYGTIEALVSSECFDEWVDVPTVRAKLNQADEQLLRRDYRRLSNMVAEIETLVHSRARTLELLNTRISEERSVIPLPVQSSIPLK